MRIETTAFYMGKQPLHSSRTGKDYVKFSLVIDGGFAQFICAKKQGEQIAAKAAKVVGDFDKTGNPVKCTAIIDLDFTERGNFTSLSEIR